MHIVALSNKAYLESYKVFDITKNARPGTVGAGTEEVVRGR